MDSLLSLLCKSKRVQWTTPSVLTLEASKTKAGAAGPSSGNWGGKAWNNNNTIFNGQVSRYPQVSGSSKSVSGMLAIKSTAGGSSSTNPAGTWWPLVTTGDRVTADSIRRTAGVKTPWELRTSCAQLFFALAGWLALVIRTLSEDVKRMSKGDAILSCIILCRNVPVHAALLGAVAVSGNAKVVVWGWVLSGTTSKATEMWRSIVQLGRDFACTTASVQHAPWPPWDFEEKQLWIARVNRVRLDWPSRKRPGALFYSKPFCTCHNFHKPKLQSCHRQSPNAFEAKMDGQRQTGRTWNYWFSTN